MHQLKAQLLRDPNVKKTILNLPNAQILKALNIPYTHPEGLFAPDTYFFAKGETDQTILKRLYQRQQNALDEAWANRASGLPYANAYEALIMASIVEKETSLDRELNQVSGGICTSLTTGHALTNRPHRDLWHGRCLTRQHQQTRYTHAHAIQIPIPKQVCRPRRLRCRVRKPFTAAMHPDDSDTLYFVATGNGGHTFSANYAAHQQAVAQ